MYGVVLGKHRHISLRELALVEPQDLVTQGNLAMFETEHPEKIETLAGIIKWGKVIKMTEIEFCELIGTNEISFGKEMKKEGLTKRFKEVELSKTDDEIKNKGKEYIVIDDERVIEVTGYQNIGLYEIVDFEKPVNSMQIGMMPSKLAQMMINIGIGECAEKNEITLYDPFVGLGTNALLANAMGYDCIASDIDITSAKRNIAWWNEQSLAKNDKRITLFKHDIYEELKKPFLKNVSLIVTEGWLGPIITEKTPEREIFKAQDEIIQLYKAFLSNVNSFYPHIVAVFTIPIHQGVSTYVKESIEERCTDNNLHCESIKEVYKREKQKVGRQIMIIKK